MLENYQNILTTEELAEILRLNERTVIKMVKEGKLPAMKIANQFRFSREKIVNWIESQMEEYSDGLLAEMEKGTFGKPMKIHRLLRPELICPEMKAKNRAQALEELSQIACGVQGLVKDRKELLRLTKQREKLHTTAVGNEIAFPHPRSVSPQVVSDILVVLAVSPKGIDFAGPDGKPVKLFVMMAVPFLGLHLQILSHVARIFHAPEIKTAILQAASPKEAISIIQKREADLGS